jgi:hypothetical protein
MMGHIDAQAALRGFFNDSRPVLNASTPNVVLSLKRQLPTEDISNGNRGTSVHAVTPVTKRRKRYVSALDLNALGKFTFLSVSCCDSHALSDPSDAASLTPATSGTESQDLQIAFDPQNVPQPDGPTLPELRASNLSTVGRDGHIAQDPPNTTAAAIPDAPGSIPPAPTSPADNRMDVDEPTPAPAENVGQAASLSRPTTPTLSSSGSTTTPTRKTHSTPESGTSHSPPMTTDSTPETVDLPRSTKNKDHPSKTLPRKRTHPSKSSSTTSSSKSIYSSTSTTKKTGSSVKTTANQNRSNPRPTRSQMLPVTNKTTAASQSVASSSRRQTTPEQSTQNETGQRNPITGSPMTAASPSLASSPRRSLASKRHDAPLKGSHEIKKEEDRLNHVLAHKAQDKKPAARVIYYDTKEFDDWPEIDHNGTMESHAVGEMLFINANVF